MYKRIYFPRPQVNHFLDRGMTQTQAVWFWRLLHGFPLPLTEPALAAEVEAYTTWLEANPKATPWCCRLQFLNILGGFYGVRFLGFTAGGTEVEYLNAGDSYCRTLIKVGESSFFWTSIGDYLEYHPRFKTV